MQDTKDQFLAKFAIDTTQAKKLRQEAKFVDSNVQEQFSCSICTLLAVGAIKCKECETMYCGACIIKWGATKPCPACKVRKGYSPLGLGLKKILS